MLIYRCFVERDAEGAPGVESANIGVQEFGLIWVLIHFFFFECPVGFCRSRCNSCIRPCEFLL